MCSCCSEPLDLRIDSKKQQSESFVREVDLRCNGFVEGYDSSYEQPGSSMLVPHTYYDSLGDSFRQNPGLSAPSNANVLYRHSTPDSDEGFVDEPSVPENLPNFEKIQQFNLHEPEARPPSRQLSASPKEKRRATSSPQITDKERRKPGRKPGQVSNVLHLWEFMRDLLRSPENSGIIEWISRAEGVFRVVNSAEVAKLWGRKKKNKKEMTYEKLSRSLRYSREEGYFTNLPKEKNYPKKLCFQFGPKSKDWQ